MSSPRQETLNGGAEAHAFADKIRRRVTELEWSACGFSISNRCDGEGLGPSRATLSPTSAPALLWEFRSSHR